MLLFASVVSLGELTVSANWIGSLPDGQMDDLESSYIQDEDEDIEGDNVAW